MDSRLDPSPPERAKAAPPGRPRVSVVIPCRNEQANIEACLQSVIGQTLPPGEFEILVIDGRSDDGTRAVIDRLAATTAHCTIIDNPRQTTPVAMNIGIRAAKGEVVAILGAHTIYPRDYLEACLDILRRHPEVDCAGGTIAHEGTTPFGRAVALAMAHPMGMGNALHRDPRHEGYAEGACFPLFRREVFDRIGCYDEALERNQDDELNGRLARSGGKVWLSPTACAAYRVRETPRALFRQFFQYGFWRTVVLRRQGFRTPLRRLVPAAMLALFAASVVLAATSGGAWVGAAVMLPAMYLAMLLGAAWAADARGPGALLRFVLATAILHLAYALGFIWALVRGLKRPAPPAAGEES